MMIEITKIPIIDESSIVEARNKIRIIAKDLKFDSFIVTNLATFTSDLSRNIYENDGKSVIEVGIDQKNGIFGLIIIFHPITDDLNIESADIFFDSLNIIRNEDGFKKLVTFKYIPENDFVPSDKFIEREKERLIRKSKTELLNEIRRKNDELFDLLSERKKTENALKESEKKLKSIVHGSPIPMYVIDQQHKVIYWNHALEECCKIKSDDVVGTDNHWKALYTQRRPCMADMVVDSDLDGINKWFNDNYTKSKFVEDAYEATDFFPKLGDEGRWLHFTAAPIKDHIGKVVGAVETLEDITDLKLAEQNIRNLLDELKESEAQLVQSEKMRSVGTMSAGVAHELNNPMMGILNFIQYGLKHIPNDNKVYEVLKDAENETNRCITIIKDLLTFSSMEKDTKEDYVNQDISEIIERVLRLLEYRIKSDQIAINKNIAAKTPNIWIKPNSIQQVFFNIINNAIDSLESRDQKEIDIDIYPKDECVYIQITDTGHGIASEDLPRIYDPFFTTKPPGAGIGLGLSITFSIIRDHDGKIECDSEVNIGTVFRVSLPIKLKER
jgi:two-component system, NtrC family, sensor kinase